MDGAFDEWTSTLLPLAVDPAGDGRAAFDVERVWACNRGALLFVAFELTDELNLQSGPRTEGQLMLTIGLPDGGEVGVDFRGRAVWHRASGAAAGDAAKLRWSDVGMLQMPTYASDMFELRFDLSGFGVGVGSVVKLDFAGSDTLAEPIPFRLGEGHVEASDRPTGASDLVRAAGADVRVASYNTEHNGLRDEKDPDRRAAIRRMIDLVDADVYCLQEEWTGSADEMRRIFDEIDPTDDGSSWSVVFDDGAAVATRHPMVALPDIPGVRAAGMVVVPDGVDERAIVVYSVHLKCCGHIGSAEDERRIEEADAISEQVLALRQGGLGAALLAYRDAPVLIAGDFNLVGSRRPLAVLEDRLGVRSLELPQMVSDEIYTWYDEGSDFAPGKLDYITACEGVGHLNGFVVNLRRLPAEVARGLGTMPGDGAASDHLMMVADVEVVRLER